MAVIFKGDSGEVISGPGRYLVAAAGTDKPERISDIMAIAWPFQPKSPWVDLGYTKDGLSIGRGHESMEHQVDQIFSGYEKDFSRVGQVAAERDRLFLLPPLENTSEKVIRLYQNTIEQAVTHGLSWLNVPGIMKLSRSFHCERGHYLQCNSFNFKSGPAICQ